MGKGKRQRKEWRKIDTQEVDDFLEKSTREERQGLAVEGIPDADLFYEDKAPDAAAAPAPEIMLPKKLAARQRMTRAQAILAGAHLAKPVVAVTMKKKKVTPKPPAPKATTGALSKPNPSKKAKTGKEVAPTEDLWSAGGDASLVPRGPAVNDAGFEIEAAVVLPKKRRQVAPPLHAPAVEIDAPGCSVNPDRELHQDAVAVAVAAEMRKVYDKDLQPTAPVARVDWNPEGDELDMLVVDGVESEDEEERNGAPDEEEEGADGRGLSAAARRAAEAKKKTQKDRNREARRRAEDAAVAARRREKRQRHELSQLKHITAEVEETLAEREERLARRRADEAERAAAEPPRLGKLRFEPLPVQVMTTEELEDTKGSLRKLKPTAVLAKERFKSLQRRGVIEPRRKANKSGKKKVEFVHGQRGDKARERQNEIDEIKAKVKTVKRGGGT